MHHSSSRSRTSSVVILWSCLCALGLAIALGGTPKASAQVTGTEELKWVALGDSYSAGVGSGQDVKRNNCERQEGAYPRLAMEALENEGWRFWSTPDAVVSRHRWHHACIGAVADHYWQAQSLGGVLGIGNETVDAQFLHLDKDVDIVSLTFGGNDIDFSDHVKDCIYGNCPGFDPDEISWEPLSTELAAIYLDMSMRIADDGHIFVLSYPELFADPVLWKEGDDSCQGFLRHEARTANEAANILAETILDAVQRANALGAKVHFVDVRDAFRGRGLCQQTQDPYIRGISVNRSESFHPSSIGHQVMANNLQACIEDVIIAGARCDEPAVEAPAPEPNGIVSTALVIDSSGSMRSNDGQGRRLDASVAYLNASLPADEVGVIEFTSRAEILSEAIPVGENRDFLRGQIRQIGAGGGTHLGRGLQAGCDVLTRANGQSRAAIFLTDGKGTYSGQAKCFADQGWRVYTIGLSSSVDAALLGQIAEQTGGYYRQINSATNIVCEFQQIRSAIEGGAVSDCGPTAHIQQDETIALTETISQPLRQITFTNIWIGSDIEMTLHNPDGQSFDRSTINSEVMIEVGPSFETITVNRPTLGQWSVELFGADIPVGGEPFSFSTVQLVDPNPPPSSPVPTPEPAPPETATSTAVPTPLPLPRPAAIPYVPFTNAPPTQDGVYGFGSPAPSLEVPLSNVRPVTLVPSPVSAYEVNDASPLSTDPTVDVLATAVLPAVTPGIEPSPSPTNLDSAADTQAAHGLARADEASPGAPQQQPVNSPQPVALTAIPEAATLAITGGDPRTNLGVAALLAGLGFACLGAGNRRRHCD